MERTLTPSAEDVALTKVLNSKEDWEYLLDHGIDSSYFISRRNEFEFIKGHYQQYGELPKADVIKTYYPNWEETPHENSKEYWFDTLFQNRQARLQNEYLEQILTSKKAGASPKEIEKIIYKLHSDLTSAGFGTKDLDVANTELELRDYQENKLLKGITGIPFGMPMFDKQTGGASPGDLGVIMGPPKNMKTWLQLFMAHNMWTSGNGNPGLIISKEIDEKKMRTRLRWFDLRDIPYQAFRTAQLGKNEDKYLKTLDSLKGTRKSLIISADDGDMDVGGGVSLIASKIDRYKPSFVMIDGGYLVTDDRGGKDWQAIKNVFRDFKRLARRKNIPIIVTTQPQRLKEDKGGGPLKRKLELEDVGGAYSIAQDCDYMFGIRRVARDVVEVYIIGIREGDKRTWQIRIDLDFGIVQELGGDEIIEEDEMNFEFETVEETVSEDLVLY